MVTVLRAVGMRFVIYLNDHQPAHVHVYGNGEARINILDMSVLSCRGMSKHDLQVALNIIKANRSLFLETWERIHG